MVAGAMLMTALNTYVKVWAISLLALIAGRYTLQWVISVVTIIVRSCITKQPARFFGPPETRHFLLLRGLMYYGFIWLWYSTLRQVPVGNAVTVVKFECFVAGIGSHFIFGERLSCRWWSCA